MSWGPLIVLLLKALPGILFLWRRRVENNDREAIHEDVQNFRGAVVRGELDVAADLLERRMREARRLRSGRSQTDAP